MNTVPFLRFSIVQSLGKLSSFTGNFVFCHILVINNPLLLNKLFLFLKMSERNLVKKYCRFRYTEEALAKALQDIKDGSETLNGASKKYDIPKSTLHNKLTQKTPNIRKMGPQTVLNELEENRIEQWITAKAMLGFPMHPSEIKDAVQKILTETSRPNPFKENRPGEKWLKLFLQRHPDVGKRNTEIISKSRAAVTESAIRGWFSEMKTYLIEHDLLDMMEDPSRIYNADETGVRTCVKSGLVLGPVSKKLRNLYEVSSGNEKESITVLCTYGASGVAAPPMVIFPYKRIPKELALSVPGDWATGRSDSGWMTGATFFEYVANVFYNWLVEKEIKLPVILFIDGHKSHYSIELYEFCMEKNIILYCLYPNSTHILQPCDVTIFKPLKSEWKKTCQAHKQRTSASITRYNFCPLFKEAYEKSSQASTIIKGFEVCGLYPLNPDNVDYSKCISSRRRELFPKQEVETGDLTFQDYKSCLKVINHFLGAAKITEYENLENEATSEDTTYKLWKFCEDSMIENKNITSPKNKPESDFDNVFPEFTLEFTETLLNDLPLEIDGVLYSPSGNDKSFQIDDKGIDAPDANQSVFAHCEIKNSDDLNKQNPTDITIKNQTGQLIRDADLEEKLLMCKVIIEAILDCVFEVAEKNILVNSNMIYTSDTKSSVPKDIESDKKIQILSDITIRKNRNTDDEVWAKHLHWPHRVEKVQKRKTTKQMPFAITSSKWLKFYEQQENVKKEKEEALRVRKLKREQKWNTSQTVKKTVIKRKLDIRKDDHKTIKNKKLRKDEKISNLQQEKKEEVKKKQTRKEVDANSNSSEDMEITEKQTTRTKDKSENKPSIKDIGEITKDVLKVGDHVIVEYDSKHYPGIIKAIDRKQYEISVMEQTSNKKWKWPKCADQIWYKKHQIVKKIHEPQPVNSRRIYDIQI